MFFSPITHSQTTVRRWLAFTFLLLLIGCTSAVPNEDTVTQSVAPLVTTADSSTQETLNALLVAQQEQPVRDLVLLTEQYKGVSVPASVTHPQADTAVLWYNNKDTNTNIETTAELRYESDTLKVWVEEGSWITDRTIVRAAEQIENEIVPTNRELFGTEWLPGIDNEPQIHIFNVDDMGNGVLGYFSSADEFPTAVNPFSNEREIMYLNLNKLELGDDEYLSVIAHEYLHMIHWYLDRNETIWLNEGMAEVAAAVNGYGDSNHMPAFLSEPDTPLTYFDYNGGDYGGAYLFSRYIYDRFGAEGMQRLAQHESNGQESVNLVLKELGADLNFDQLFADWVAANYLSSNQFTTTDAPLYDGVIFPQGVYGENLSLSGDGETALTDVHPYGTDYFRIGGGEPATFVFTGTQQVPLFTTEPYSGRYMWSTVPGDSQNSSLTRSIDLTAVPTATLRFATWYDIELGWDYAYVSVSDDDGASWTTLQTVASSEANPNGNNLGYGYTGTSGSRQTAVWIEQTADLTPFAGQQLLLRFDYVTDTAIHQQGIAIDDIAIPEIGFFDDAETDMSWEAHGFARHMNQLPQTFLAQLLLINQDEQVTIQRLEITADNHGRWQIPLTTETPRAVIAISGLTPITFQPASYAYHLE